MTEPGRLGEPPPTPPPVAADVVQRTSMGAERTWLAWWRTALAATVGALGVGRLAPELLDVASWPYVVLGAGYACLAIGLLLAARSASVTSSGRSTAARLRRSAFGSWRCSPSAAYCSP
jgi:uncharacterized membrane protein YidH (DUF202 family)